MTRSLPKTADSGLNPSPVNCMPSPEFSGKANDDSVQLLDLLAVLRHLLPAS